METTNQKKQWEVSEIQLVYSPNIKPSERPKISQSKDAYEILKACWNNSTLELFEQFKVILVNRANRVLGIFEVSSGGISGTVADPKLIFAAAITKKTLSGAIRGAASGIILAHNHPSGNLTPSQADIDLTRKLKEGGKYLEIQVLDHIILTSEKYFSFADEGVL